MTEETNDVIPNIGATDSTKQLAVHVSHEDPDAIVVSGAYDGKIVGATIIFSTQDALVNDAMLAQMFIAFSNSSPDTVDVQHIGRVHETD